MRTILSCRYLLLLSFTLFAFTGTAISQDTVRLSNAFYIAKALNNFSDLQLKEKERILGAIYWFSKNELNNIQTAKDFWDYLKQYKVLDTEVELLAKSATPPVDLASFSVETIIDCFIINTTDKSRDAIKRKITNVHSKYTNVKKGTLTSEMVQQLENNADSLEKDLQKISSLQITASDSTAADSAATDKKRLKIEDSLKRLRSQLSINRINSDSLLKLKDSLNSLSNQLPIDVRQCLNNIKFTDQNFRENLNLQGFSQKYSEQVIMEPGEGDKGQPGVVIGLPGQTQVYDALAIYLVKRVKQEAIMWFFEELRKNMNAYHLVKDCFPNCLALLQSKEIYEAPKMGSLWRYAISKDYATMPEHLFDSDWLKSKLAGSPHLLEGLKTSRVLSRLINQNYSFANAITYLYTSQRLDLQYRDRGVDLNHIITLLFAINDELRFNNGRRLQFADLNSMTDKEFEMMISLIDMKYSHIFRSLLLKKQDGVELNNTRHLNVIRKWLGSILLAVQQFEDVKHQYAEYIRNKGNTDLQFQYDEYNLWTFLKTIFSSVDLTEVKPDPAIFKTFDERTTALLKTIGNVQEVYRLLESKNFAGSVSLLMEVVRDLVPKSDTLVLTTKDVSSFLYKKRLKMFSELSGKIDSSEHKYGYRLSAEKDTMFIYPQGSLYYLFTSNDEKAFALIRKVSGFLNDVAYTQGSKQLAQVIESYAMPPGSYKLKRAAWFSLDLNAYVGAYSGYEWTRGETLTGTTAQKNDWVYGLTAPVGISFSKTFGKRIKNPDAGQLSQEFADHSDQVKMGRKYMWKQSSTTLTAFFSIIDVGAIVSYRFTNNADVLPQEIRWSQLFSPGIHLNWGIPSTPLVLSVGYQYTPKLRRIKFDTDDEQLNSNRVYLGLKFDIPLFNLSYRSENNNYVRKAK